jgi:hypothetical protein
MFNAACAAIFSKQKFWRIKNELKRIVILMNLKKIRFNSLQFVLIYVEKSGRAARTPHDYST